MTYKINFSNRIYEILFFIFLTFILYFVWVKFAYIASNNYFLLNQKYIDNDIIIVALDDKTINSNNFKRFQDINRSDYADLLRIISYDEPKAVFTDVVFSNKTTDDKKLLDTISRNDNMLFNIEIIKKENKYETLENIIIPKENLGYPNINSFNSLNNFFEIISWSDIKNIMPIYLDFTILPIPFELYRVVNDFILPEISQNYIKIWEKKIEISNNWFNINFFTKNYPEVSFIDVLDWKIESWTFKDKVVFVWATALDIHDLFLSPISPTSFIPWVVILANAYNTIVSDKYLHYPNIFIFLIINLFFLSLIYVFFEKFKSIYFSMIFSIWVLFWFIIFWIVSFLVFWLFIELLPFFVCFIFLHIYIFIKRYFKEKKSKDDIKNIFWRYISKDVVNDLVKTWIDNLKLGWTKREITVFFSDLAWFTDLSENLDPTDLWKILNIYFEEMSNVVLENNWTIDKFIWDAIMAFWNAPLDVPNHADLACKTAILQRKALLKVREELKNMWSNVYIDMRIWINTWDAVIWNFWCSKRYDYTALWDTVNLWSRLEGINKQYGTNVIISESTFNAISKDIFVTRELDIITVKWKKKPIKIYELIWLTKNYKQEDLKDLVMYKEALNFYKQKNFKKAIEIFKKIDDAPSKSFIVRCEYYIANPPPEDWDGVYRFKTK